MGKSILIIGEDPSQIDFEAPDAPKGMSASKVMDGLNGSLRRLEAAGHSATLLLTKDAETVGRQVTEALTATRYDVIVIGAGLRVLPPMDLPRFNGERLTHFPGRHFELGGALVAER
jgi:hypothetical protein